MVECDRRSVRVYAVLLRVDSLVLLAEVGIVKDRPRDYSSDCKYRVDWGKERTRWLRWWESRLGVSYWMRVL